MKSPFCKEKSDIIILGIDPGSIITGYGVILISNNQMKAIDFGCIRPKTKKLSARYAYLFQAIDELVEHHAPDAMAIENQYVNKNVQSALKLAMAKGACLLPLSLRKIPIFEYTPSRAKCAVTGSGRASKAQIQAMVKHRLNLSQLPEPEDAADALAIAICHINAMKAPLFKGKDV